MTVAAGGPVLLADPRIVSIPLEECGERLVPLGGLARVSVGDASPVPPLGLRPPAGPAQSLRPGALAADRAYAHVREGLAVRLERAAGCLPRGLRLHVVEGYRSPAAQRAYFEAYRGRILGEEPGLSRVESEARASRFVAPPDVAAHPSGAAVDVTLVDQLGRSLDMGTAIDATPEESDGACYFGSPVVAEDVRARRRLLAACLEGAGLVNYPTEWWHWSFGDRYWAFATGNARAIYGPVAGT